MLTRIALPFYILHNKPLKRGKNFRPGSEILNEHVSKNKENCTKIKVLKQ
jgi:hypothetical protein